MIYGNWGKNSKEFLNDIIQTSKNSEEVLFISGFSSIGFFAYLFKEIYTDRTSKTKKICLLLGNEISKSGLPIKDEVSNHFKDNSFDFYYFKGIELLRQFIENKQHLDNALGWKRDFKLEVKIETGERRLHAKVFVFQDSIIFGSSNLSYSGIVEQLEVNEKVSLEENPEKYKKIYEISKDLWNSKTAIDYKKDLFNVFQDNIEIIKDFSSSMQFFQDFYINGNWFKTATQKYQNELYEKLWIHQKRSIWQALKILNEAGAVIIAEPTGSGKTKIASTILRYLYDKYSEDNTLSGRIVVICPPNVESEWTEEIIEKYKITGVDVISSGVIADLDSDRNTKHRINIQNAKIILLDEAHLYSNLLSKRGKNLLVKNQTDYLIMLTATPLNKVIEEYKGLIMQIGGDCLNEEQVENLNNYIFKKNPKKYVFDLDEHEKEYYKEAITSITVRKTKQEINQFSLENKSNTNVGRYPEENTKEYSVSFQNDDTEKIKKINAILKDIKGLAFINKEGKNIKNPIRELSKIQGLAKHFLIYNLRSSKVAVIEHIAGTEHFEIKNLFDRYPINKKINSGKIKELEKLKKEFKWSSNLQGIWKDKNHFNADIDKEIENYKEILKNILDMSDCVALSKINSIEEIMETEVIYNQKIQKRKCLVFDKTPITILYLNHLLNKIIKEKKHQYRCIHIIGENKDKNLNNFKSAFGLDKKGKYLEEGVVGFTSNVLSESVNLQGADCLLFSDIPLTPTTADQRVGRISRMNSPYDEINIYWPNFPQELFLNTDRLLVYRYINITETIKANITLPSFLEKNIPPVIADYLKSPDKKIELNNDAIGLDNNTLEITKELQILSSETTIDLDDKNREIIDDEDLELNKDFKEFFQPKSNIDIEDCFEKLNKLFQNLIGKNTTSNKNHTNNKYNFISITDKEHLNNEWGLFVVSTNINATPHIIFINKKTQKCYIKLEDIVIELEKCIPGLDNIETVSLIKTTITENDFSSTMKYYQKELENIFNKSSTFLTKKQEKAFERMKDYVETLYQYSDDKNDRSGFKEIIDKIKDNNKNTPKIAQKWFNFFIKHWSDEMANALSKDNRPFNNKIPTYANEFNTDRMHEKMKLKTAEDIYMKFLSESDNNNKKKIKFRILFSAVCFPKQDFKS